MRVNSKRQFKICKAQVHGGVGWRVGESGVKLGVSRTETSRQLTHSEITELSDFIWFIKGQQASFSFSR